LAGKRICRRAVSGIDRAGETGEHAGDSEDDDLAERDVHAGKPRRRFVSPHGVDDERLADRQDTARGECADRVRKIRSVKEDVALGHDPREHDEDQTDVALQRSEQRQHPPQPAADGCGRDRHRRDRRFSGRAR
jgi:hypothetical protein